MKKKENEIVSDKESERENRDTVKEKDIEGEKTEKNK